MESTPPTIGLYGVVSYMVIRRRAEIGVRMALGAAPHQVIRMVPAESGGPLAAGVAIGVVLAILAARYTASLLYGLQPGDVTSFALAVATLSLALHRRVDSRAPRRDFPAHHSVARINRAEPQRTAS